MRTTLAALSLLLLLACKNDRETLEQLVPDGATAIVSIDVKAMMGGELKPQIEAAMALGALSGNGDPASKAITALRDTCKIDPWALESVVVGIDALSQSVVVAVRMPKLGTADALGCIAEVAKQQGGETFTLAEADGKPTVAFADKAEGWAIDDDTLVVTSKAWASGVKGRIAGEGKAAIDGGLAEAVALADRGRHVWLAGEVPAIASSALDQTPAKGLRRAGGSVQYGKEIEIAAAAAFADAEAAKALHAAGTAMLAEAKADADDKGEPVAQKILSGITFEQDGAVVRGKVVFELQPVIDESVKSFTNYMNKSKTVEASMYTSRIADAVSAAHAETATCPTDGRDTGETGITPPLSVDCSKGMSGNCAAVASPSAPGEYAASAWRESPVWDLLRFEASMPHRFHYNYKWTKTATGCDFVVQAFGDLDGDATYSTFERAGSITADGVSTGSSTLSEVDPFE